MAFEPEHTRGLDGIAQHAVVVAGAVRAGQHGDVTAVTTAATTDIEVDLQRPRVGQHGAFRTRHLTPTTGGAGLEPCEPVAGRVGSSGNTQGDRVVKPPAATLSPS